MLGYLNNFPREDGVKGQKFEGDKTLEDELKNRGIIGEIDEPKDVIVVKEDNSKEIVELNTTITALEGEKTTLTEKVTALEGEKTTLTEKVTALEGENGNEAHKAEIAKLNGYIEEAIGLQKGHKPKGYEKAI